MAIHRGIQSALFYYLSCAPCVEARYRKRRKQEAVRGRVERQLLEAEHPNLYRQPSPSSTNPHWQSEIALGPTRAVRGRRKNNAAGQRTLGVIAGNTSVEPSSVHLPQDPRDDNGNDSRWNFRVYQREDEELWGSASNVDTASSSAGSLTRPQKALTKDPSPTSYHTFRNPEVNEMHPATVTKVTSPEEVMWMLQPPPVAEIMQGKERVSRSRSDSGGSRMMSSSSVSLSRQLSSRLVQGKLKSLDTNVSMSRESSSRTGTGTDGQRHDRSATISQRDFAVSPVRIDSRDPRMPSPVLLPHDMKSFDRVSHQRDHIPPDTLSVLQSKTGVARPQLSTIRSNRELRPRHQSFDVRPSQSTSRENEIPTPPQSREESSSDPAGLALQFPYVMADASVTVTGDTTSRSLSGKVIRTNRLTDMIDGGRHTPGHSYENSEDFIIRPELFESWHTPDFELGKWVHETTKREVKQRWSMDL